MHLLSTVDNCTHSEKLMREMCTRNYVYRIVLKYNGFYLSSKVDGEMGISPRFSNKLAVNHFLGTSHIIFLGFDLT